MATTVLGLRDNYADPSTIDADDLNALATNLEWVACGYIPLDVSGNTDVELTAAQYETNVLDLVGTLTGNISVEFPAHAGRRWLVHNGTSGAFTLTVKVAGQTGVTITQGFAALVAGDGTDLVRRGPDVSTGGALVVTSPRIVTSVLDSNGNELFRFTATASAVNEFTLANAATGAGPVLEATGDDTNIDCTVRGKGSGGVQISRSGGKLAFFGATLVARAAALTQTYATADRTLSAYTADNESGAYTGIDNAQGGTPYAQLTDLNALRAAYENLRALTEDLAQFVNALVDDLQAYGLEQ